MIEEFTDYLSNKVIYQIKGMGARSEMQWHVGQRIPAIGGNISRIERDPNQYYQFGNTVYLVYVSIKDVEKLWRYYENVPAEVVLDVKTKKNDAILKDLRPEFSSSSESLQD